VVTAATASAAGADGKRLWVALAAGVAAVFGAFAPTVSDRFTKRRETRKTVDARLSKVLMADLPISPALLLHPYHEVVPFVDRLVPMSDLKRWASDRRAAPVRLIVGVGGIGKTRLIQEAAKRLAESREWRILRIRLGGEAETAEMINDGSLVGTVLLIVDYAETRNRADLASLLCAAQSSGRVWVMLSARTASWWRQLSAAYPQQAHLVDALTVDRNVISLDAEIPYRDPQQIIDDAKFAYECHLEISESHGTVPSVVPPSSNTPILLLHAEALISALGGRSNDRRDVLHELLLHEARYWRGCARRFRLLDPEDPETNRSFRQVVGFAALLGADNWIQAEGVVRRAPSATAADPDTVRTLTEWFASLYPSDDFRTSGVAIAEVGGQAGEGSLGNLQPSLLSEALAVDVLHECTDVQRQRVFTGLSDTQAVHAVTVLGRASQHKPGAIDMIRAAIAADPPRMRRALDRAIPTLPAKARDLLEQQGVVGSWTSR
jgi:hypothetical protein